MSWKPTIGGGPTDDEAPTPSRRRRRRPEPPTPNTDAVVASTRPRSPTLAKPPAGRHSSPGRNGLKLRLGERWSQIVREVKAGEYTWMEFVESLDEEELARGQLRSDDGRFIGRPPTFVPREFLLASQREMKRRFEEIFGSEVLGIAQEYVKLARDNAIPAKDRAKMMQYAMERIFGGIPKEVKLTQEQPWEQVFVNVTTEGNAEMPSHLRERYARYQERDADPDTED